jgi:hypothetical protein
VSITIDPDFPDGPLKPGLHNLAITLMEGYEFARDAGGELFLLPGEALRDKPYIPRSFLTQDVMNLAHCTWHEMAVAWNNYVLTEGGGGKLVAVTPSDTLIRNAGRHLEALASEHGHRVTAELRAVQVNGGIVIDLGDDTGEVIHVTAEGWKVTDPRSLPFPPPVFRRSTGYGPLPRPEHGGDLAELWKILRLDGDGEDAVRARLLGTGWLTAAFFAGVKRPGLWFTGPAGSGKTTIGGALARIIDGTEWLDGRLDKTDERNNIIRAAKCYVVSFDNMTAVTADLSDWICTLVTGHRDTFRKMRTNFDDVSMAYKRTFIATGLALPYGLAADALERVNEVPLPPLGSSRVSDERLQAELDEARPRLLGAVLDHVAAPLGKLGGIPAELENLTRMSGYANVLLAHDLAYAIPGQPGPGCLQAYLEAAQAAREDRADGEPVTVALGRMFARPACGQCAGCQQREPCLQPRALPWCRCAGCTATPKAACQGSTWEGTAKQLWDALSPHRSFGLGGGDTWWPADAQRLSDHLTTQDGVLRAAGFMVSRSPRRTKHGRLIRITCQPAG